MQLYKTGELDVSTDLELIARHIPLEGAHLLELGCGAAATTRALAESFPVAHIDAFEVDEIQHARNQLLDDLPRVTFELGGMQAIPRPDESVDAVIMLKSLHHVPPDLMARGFTEVHRVLRPGGLVYISEPVFAGDFNAIMRLFHDEEQVREAAFAAIGRAIAGGGFSLAEEIHFASPSRFEGFADFEQRVLGATHSSFDIDAGLHERIRARFEKHVDADGAAEFLNPTRVDVLCRR